MNPSRKQWWNQTLWCSSLRPVLTPGSLSTGHGGSEPSSLSNPLAPLGLCEAVLPFPWNPRQQLRSCLASSVSGWAGDIFWEPCSQWLRHFLSGLAFEIFRHFWLTRDISIHKFFHCLIIFSNKCLWKDIVSGKQSLAIISILIPPTLVMF